MLKRKKTKPKYPTVASIAKKIGKKNKSSSVIKLQKPSLPTTLWAMLVAAVMAIAGVAFMFSGSIAALFAFGFLFGDSNDEEAFPY